MCATLDSPDKGSERHLDLTECVVIPSSVAFRGAVLVTICEKVTQSAAELSLLLTYPQSTFSVHRYGASRQ